MSYRRSKATTERIRRQIEAMRRGKARAQQALDLAHQQGQIASDKAEMDALIAAGARVRT